MNVLLYMFYQVPIHPAIYPYDLLIIHFLDTFQSKLQTARGLLIAFILLTSVQY